VRKVLVGLVGDFVSIDSAWKQTGSVNKEADKYTSMS
jgi:hypothetical protein